MNVAKASAILCVYSVLLCLSLPGISFLKTNFLRNEKSKEAFEEAHGEVAARLASLAGDISRHRRPIAKKLGAFQPVFRIRQSWHLYRDGPRTIRRMEVQVDGETIYRTGNPDHDWNVSIFRNRRIRPMAETFVKKPKAKNPMGLVRYIVNHARQDFPGAETIEVRALWGSRQGPAKLHHRVVASAPDWALEHKP